jgi:hypothetical protein
VKLQVAAAAVAAGVVACSASGQWLSPWGSGGNGGSGIGYQGGAVNSPVVDPMGDAQDTFGAGPPLLDIDTISVSYNATDLMFSMTFHTPIAAPSEALPESMGGLFEMDLDLNSLTGAPPLQNAFSPPFAMLDIGADFILDLFSEAVHPGFVDLFPIGPGVPALVPVTYTDFSVSATIPLSALNDDDGELFFTTIIGTFPQPTDATDVVGLSVPAPGAAMLLGFGALASTRRRR